MSAAFAGSPGQPNAGPAGNSMTVAAGEHRPIAAAGGRYRGCNGLASAEHHVAAVRRRLHPHSPCASFGVTSHCNILGNGARRSAMPHETRVIEAVAAGHVIGVLLREPVERRTIRKRRSGPGDRGAHDSDYSKRSHRAPLALVPLDSFWPSFREESCRIRRKEGWRTCLRHGRLYAGHPRLRFARVKAWMPATSAGMTEPVALDPAGACPRAGGGGNERGMLYPGSLPRGAARFRHRNAVRCARPEQERPASLGVSGA